MNTDPKIYDHYFYNKAECWIKLVPAVSFIVVSAALSPSFALAYTFTALEFSIILIINTLFTYSYPDPNQNLVDAILKKQFMVTLQAPILEECLFRGILLQLLLLGLGFLCPSTIIFPYLGLSCAEFLAILISAISFALIHILNAEDLFNPTINDYCQVVNTFFLGLFLGYIALQLIELRLFCKFCFTS